MGTACTERPVCPCRGVLCSALLLAPRRLKVADAPLFFGPRPRLRCICCQDATAPAFSVFWRPLCLLSRTHCSLCHGQQRGANQKRCGM